MSGHALPSTRFGTGSAMGRTLRQRWGIVLGTTGVCVAAAGLYLSQVTPQYQAVVVLRLESLAANADRAASDPPDDRWHEQHLKAQLAMLKGRRLAEHVVDELGLERAYRQQPAAPPVEPLPYGRNRQPPEPETPGLALQLDRELKALPRHRDPARLPPDNVIIAREAAIRAFRASLSVDPVPRSDLVQIRVLDRNRSQAAQNANTLARGFLAMQGARRVPPALPPAQAPAQNPIPSPDAPLTEPIWADWPPAGPYHEWLQSRLDADMKRLLYSELLGPVTPWWLTPDAFANVPNPPIAEPYAALEPALETVFNLDATDVTADLQNPYTLWKLLGKPAHAQPSPLTGDQAHASGAVIISEATAPQQPHNPRPYHALGLALVLGLLAGTLLALRKSTDPTAEMTMPDPAHPQPGLPPLGSIPKVALPEWADSVPVALLTHTDPQGPLAQAHRSIAQALLDHPTAADHAPLLVTSHDEGEGSTTTAVGLAIALSQLGQTVLLIDANLRAPDVHQTLHLPNEIGLSQQLGATPAAALPIQATSIDNLSVLSAGSRVPEPLQRLLGPGLGAVLAQVAQLGYQRVVIDSAPLHGHADTLVLANRVPHVLLVVQQAQATQANTLAARQQLHDAGARWVGCVITQARPA